MRPKSATEHQQESLVDGAQLAGVQAPGCRWREVGRLLADDAHLVAVALVGREASDFLADR